MSTFASPGSATSGLQGYDLEGARRRRRKRRKKPTTEAADAAMENSAMSDELKLFIPITKIDAAKRLVYGVATAEVEDRSGEICDYASTKPLYEKWSSDFAKVTDGKSFGNLRAMHGNVAAGKLTEINFNDTAKAIEICAKVVDDAEWTKVEEGVYTGFSQGGKYIKRWTDDDGKKRYTAEPLEVSIVDFPCLAESTFQVIKADGTTEVRKFKPTAAPAKAPSFNDIARKATELAKAAGDETKWANYVEAATAELTKTAPAPAAVAEPAAAAVAPGAIPHGAVSTDDGTEKQVWVHPSLPGEQFATKGEMRKRLIEKGAEQAAKEQFAPALTAIADIKTSLAKATGGDAGDTAGKTTTAPNAGDGKAVTVDLDALGKQIVEFADAVKTVQSPDDLRRLLIALPTNIVEKIEASNPDLAKRTYSAKQRKEYAAQGIAMKDGSYPIPDKDALSDAISAFGRAKNKAATKRHIIRRAKALKATDMLPADWPGSTKEKDSKKLVLAGDGNAVQKNLYFVSNLVSLLASLEQFEEDYEMITRWGAADAERNELCNRFGTVLTDFADLVADILDRAISGITAEEQGEASGAIQRANVIVDLIKINGVFTLAKAGAKHAKADKDRIKQAHDLLVELDPDCCDAEDDDEPGDAEKLAKQLEAERGAYGKMLSDVIMPAIKDLGEQIGKVKSTVQTIADQPLPIGTSSVRVAEKRDDSQLTATAEKLLDQPGVLEAFAEAAIRKAQTQPMRTLPGTVQR